MVGDLQRIRVYPAEGFQIHQDIPDEVWRGVSGARAQQDMTNIFVNGLTCGG